MSDQPSHQGPEPSGLTSSFSSAAEASRWNQRALFFLGTLTLLRLIIHACGLVGVSGDEAYYWEWGRHPALGYFSKPPLIGWIMGLLEVAGLGTTFGLKAAATVFSSIALWGIYDFTRQWFGHRTAWWTLAITGLSVGSFALASFLTIDALLLPAWSVALAAGSRVLREGPKTSTVVALTLALAFGMLGKQMMMLFPVLLFAVAGISRAPRKTWIALVGCSFVSLLALVPPLIWNAHHGWATITHTAHHFESAPETPVAIVSRFGEFAAVQFLLAGPVALLMAIAALRGRGNRRRYRIPLIFGAIGWLVCLAMNVRQEMNPNWPAVYLFSWLPAGVAWALDHHPRLTRISLWTNLVLSLGMLAALTFLPLWNKGDKKLWTGWPDLAREVDAIQPPTTGPSLLIVAGSRFTASQIAFRTARRPELHAWNYGLGDKTQFDFWPGPQAPSQRPVVVVLENGYPIPEKLLAALVNPSPARSVHIRFGLKHGADFDLIRADGLNSWPAPGPSAP